VRQLLAVGSPNGWLKIWNLETRSRIAAFPTEDATRAVSWHSNGRHIIVGDAAGRIYFLELMNLGKQKSEAFLSQEEMLALAQEMKRTLEGTDRSKSSSKGKIRKSDPCPCGSGKKYSRCCAKH
jgi:WD40 repeat protein